MQDPDSGNGSSKPNSADDGKVTKFPYDQIGDDLAGIIEVEERDSGSILIRVIKPITIKLKYDRQWAKRFVVHFLAGVVAALFMLWLKDQPAFQDIWQAIPHL